MKLVYNILNIYIYIYIYVIRSEYISILRYSTSAHQSQHCKCVGGCEGWRPEGAVLLGRVRLMGPQQFPEPKSHCHHCGLGGPC